MVLSPVVTYSPAFTLVPTYECFNRCAYCNFRTDPGQSPWLTLEAAARQLKALQGSGISEILVLSGEVHPHSPRRAAWVQHLYQMCELALSLGFLPHTNAGPLSYEEMVYLKTVNVSMGLMLEQLTPRWLDTVHRHAPSKDPALRLQQLDWAGSLQIPFTTGLLLGLGETDSDRCDTLRAIAQSHHQWGHIQEVILQPYCPGQQDPWSGPAFPSHELASVVAIARQILPEDITLQIPPNLIHTPQALMDCLDAGARDLGGIVPLDHVNPDYSHVSLEQMTQQLSDQGWQLTARLPIYPQFDDWLAKPLQKAVLRWRQSLHPSYTEHSILEPGVPSSA